MKRTKEDMLLAEMLKKESLKPEANEWFTPRVLNRLPEKRHHSGLWLKVLVYGLVILGVVAWWVYYCHNQDTNVITVRDIITYATSFMASLAVLAIAIIDFARTD
ncbi:MAG: hypothetical protein ACI30R_00825 [Sodaliphilus sp.]